VRHALPVLAALGARATFFLSGRALHGLGAYWWVALERMITERGLRGACQTLGVAGGSPTALADACVGTPVAERLGALAASVPAQAPAKSDPRVLRDAGMTVGFHTLHHPALTTLADAELDAALADGRHALAAAAGAPVDLLAYPHGLADRRVAQHARAAGYRAAFRMGARPVSAGSDRFLLPRWDPGSLEPAALVAHLALRLNYPDAGPRG
ncbi:MAG: polysaccharide deacetylase family protein, partial [Gemmatimonadaceae bacterium]